MDYVAQSGAKIFKVCYLVWALDKTCYVQFVVPVND